MGYRVADLRTVPVPPLRGMHLPSDLQVYAIWRQRHQRHASDQLWQPHGVSIRDPAAHGASNPGAIADSRQGRA
jgi:hypothetical protein